jgi:HD-GYP domain-containing protein (c-di-GMP phosphodiesterase class II)
VKFQRDIFTHRQNNVRTRQVLLVTTGTLINVLLSFAAYKFGLPFFLDSLGTILVSAVSGMLLLGILTAVITSLVCSLFNQLALYLAFANALLAIFTVWFIQKYTFKKFRRNLVYVLIASVYSAIVISLIHFAIYKQTQNSLITQFAHSCTSDTGLPYLLSLTGINLILQLADKSISCLIVVTILRFIPKEKFNIYNLGAWLQRPLTEQELNEIKNMRKKVKRTLRSRTTNTLVITSFMVMFLTGWTGLSIYSDNEKAKKTETAWSTVRTVASIIDVDKIDDYLLYGNDADGYNETSELLSKMFRCSTDLAYLYVVKPEGINGRFIFDVDTRIVDPDAEPPYVPGELVPFEESFKPYFKDMLEGKEIGPIETDDVWGWLLTVYYPVKDSDGNMRCYVGADVSLKYIADYTVVFFFKIILTMAGFFILIVAFALWKTGVYTSIPISSISSCLERFALSGEDQAKLDENVKIIRSLDIHTQDEVERLYSAICEMTLKQAEQMRDIRHLSESTLKMQDGLIITMADMVESRDSDTGAHVQKTSEYVKIIVEGLKKKGYYAQKITPKFMSDVVRSAPLHDVGKINIPDGVLNKPGKLTPEEFEIMKKHTIAGKVLLENAISTVQGENYLKEARNMAAYHHERWDGKGYPEGLHGELIPLSARIMAVADVFDALVSPRIYKPAFTMEKAIEILQEGAGTQFDAKCVEVFIDALPEVKEILNKYSTNV